MDELELASLRIAVGLQPSEDLPRIAADALARGVDSPSLRAAAGLSSSEVRAAADYFKEALSELGYDAPDEQEALWRLACQTAEAIVQGDIAPYEGADWIWRNIANRMKETGDLRIFIGLASEIEDHPDYKVEYERQIVENARDLLDRGRPRRWVMVMARHGHSPTCGGEQERRDVDPAELPIAVDLASELRRWAERHDATFGRGIFESDGSASADDAVDFVEVGRALSRQLQEALGRSWYVEYRQEPTRPPGLRVRQRVPDVPYR
jgi:hypothetical protein